ncbi:MAG TPA: alpha/beta hydrolase [Candidatus Sulfomarinibacteraceae bacterium]|nr:alpha/beta hydrolase [Candidatus Sulfomarinibacteraceae bacterium]
MHVERAGDRGPVILLVHGSILPGWRTWSAQRPLAEHCRLVVPHRSGYPPNPPLDRIDFEVQAREIADLIEPGTHVVGHSYGGLISLLAVADALDHVRSLSVIEPPAFGVARGNAAVEELIGRLLAIGADGIPTPRAFLVQFADAVGATPNFPDPLPPELEASARATMAERLPWEAEVPFGVLRQAGFPKLVFSGAHSPAFDAVCDVLVDRLGAGRAVIAGAGHSVQRTGEPFNRRLRAFIDAA